MEKEVFDVEVEETELEENTEEQVMQNEPQYSDEEIDVMVQKLKTVLMENNNVVNDEIFTLAQVIANNSKEYLDNDTYLWVMHVYSLWYKQNGNANAEIFINIRMRSVVDAMVNKRPQQQALTFVDTDFPETIIQSIVEKTNFMDDEMKSLKSRILQSQATMSIFFGCIFKFVLNYSWILSIGIGILLFIVNYKISLKSVTKRFVKEQCDASKSYCEDPEIILFDLPVYNS